MDGGRQVIGTVLQGSYRIERRIGEGSMGAVYEASHLRIARRFAVKVLLPVVAEHADALTRFRREAEITSALGHPHILEIIDFNETPDGIPYILMEYLDGEDLAARIRRDVRLGLPLAATVLRQAASALHAAHQKGVIHRDLKPQNIFLCKRGERDDYVKVVDFGISKVLGARSVLTAANALIGTPCYMSPEQAEERAAEVDLRADVYAMAVIVYEMLTGRPPFMGDSIPGLLYKIVHAAPPRLSSSRPDLPEALDHVLRKALAKDRQKRFGSMADFWQAFEQAMEGGPWEVWEPTDIGQMSPPARQLASGARAAVASRGALASQSRGATGPLATGPTAVAGFDSVLGGVESPIGAGGGVESAAPDVAQRSEDRAAESSATDAGLTELRPLRRLRWWGKAVLAGLAAASLVAATVALTKRSLSEPASTAAAPTATSSAAPPGETAAPVPRRPARDVAEAGNARAVPADAGALPPPSVASSTSRPEPRPAARGRKREAAPSKAPAKTGRAGTNEDDPAQQPQRRRRRVGEGVLDF